MLSFLLLCAVSLAVATASAPPLVFNVLGDWGGQDDDPYTTKAESRVAAAMGEVAASVRSQFTVALGDNFYDYGVKNIHDPRFNETFEDVFTAPSLQHRWYALAGNHDHYGNASAQVAYTKLSKRWFFPAFYYTETLPLGGGASLQFVFIDTVLLCGQTHPTLRHLPPSGPASVAAAEDQWAWIEQTLSTSTADWLIVAGHYPVWSIGKHGPTSELVERLRPLLFKYRVSAYLCGHDHSMQHLREVNTTLDYFVVGAGHLTETTDHHKKDVPKHSLLYWYAPSDKSEKHGAFATVSIDQQSLNTTYYSSKDKLLYSTQNTHPRQKTPAARSRAK